MKNSVITLNSFRQIIKENKFMLALFFLSILVVFSGLSTHSFALDEIFSIFISKDWPVMINTLWNEEANMWFYYIILYFWRTLGTNEFVIRSLSIIFAIGSIPLTYGIAKHLFNKKVARISVLLLVLNFFYIIAAQFARGYSLLLFLTLASMYSFLRFGENKKFKVLYVLSSALSIYTHFYAGLVLLSQFLTATLTKKLKRLFYAYLAVGVFLIPILLSPSFRSGQIDWIIKPTLTNLLGTVFVLTGDFPPLLIVFGLIFVFIAPHVMRNIKKFKYQILLLWLFTPIVTAFSFSLLIKPVYQSVYFLISLPPFLILAADGVNRFSKQSLKRILLITIVALSLLRLSLWYSQNTDYKWVFSNNDEDWRLATYFIDDNARDYDAIIFYGYYNKMPYEHYSQKNTPKVVEISEAPYSFGGGSELPKPNYEILTKLDYERVWLLRREADRGLLNRDEQLAEIQTILDKNYSPKSVHQFPGLKLILYEYET